MRLNPFAAYRDYSRKKELKQLLLGQMKKLPAGGSGIDVPMGGDEAPVWAAVVQELLREYPNNLTVVRFKNGLMLCKSQDFAGISDELKKSMKSSGAVAAPGDDLHDIFTR